METRARTSSAPASTSYCPACEKPVDSLRAGQVAILDGGFRYFCDATCKNAYVDAVSKRPMLDSMMTADPPPVASSARSARPPVVASGVRELAFVVTDSAAAAIEREPGQPYFPAVAEDASDDEDRGGGFDPPIPESVRVVPAVEHASVSSSARANADRAAAFDDERDDLDDRDDRDERDDLDERDERDELDASPSTLRSPSVSELATARAERRRAPRRRRAWPSLASVVERVLTAAPVVGVFSGVLAAVVSLAGDSAGAFRLPLALSASVVVIALRTLASRERSDEAAWAVTIPIAAASVLATLSAALHDPHADAHASFVGLAAASALTVDVLVARARRDVLAARERTSRGLAVTARVVRGDDLLQVAASLVKPGEQVVVEAGETIPVDGIVVAAGNAEVAPWLDSASLAQKSEGDAVVAGAVVVSGRLRVNATFSGSERAWLRLTQPAAGRIDVAAPLVVFVRRAIVRGAPAAAVLVGGAVYAENGAWLDVAIAACGGGLALSAGAAATAAALAHARGHVAAQRRGIVYKDAAAFDAAARADVAVVCSRGTILLGDPEIVAVESITKEGVSPKGWLRSPTPGLQDRLGKSSADDVDKSDVARILGIAAGAEMSSSHPFASAIVREARTRGIRPDNVRSAVGHSGLGVTALAANGDRVIVGSRAFLLQEKVSVAIADARASELESQGRSVLLVAVGGRLVGLLALQDGLRPGARAAIQKLHDARIEPVLLSGEARDTCETIARALDIEHVRPEILPSDRGAEVRALADGGRIVAALGHASTDDGALGAADVSIAMDSAGAAPGEWGVALASDDVRDAALSLTIPRSCRDRARTAVVVGLLVQGLGALGIAFGIVPPAVVPVLGLLGAIGVVSIVREPSAITD